MVETTRQFCTFFLDDHFFGVNAHQVQEVIRYQEMTQVPLTPASVAGLINLRGQIVTALDMRARLGYSNRTEEKLPMNVVIRSDDGAVSLLVDRIGDVIDVNTEDYESLPDTLQGPARDYVEGAYKLDNQLLLVLNTTEVVQDVHSS
ncbi:chemotaxis protein CheW [Rhodopirellula europaea]|uniref:CheW protein n=1 Tax=Rhodopirellula europaea 6C TaxID=1263867 RepID=M2AR06_9BACT|nr:chemotaxis protein CheW [Rhodopirellula europaea]EMB15167.1 CheW protein [Rhodopirellula europaea 6C]